MRVVVVGAGITGLTAAWALRGHDVTVLDSGTEPGGRMRTQLVGGLPMETGAQFLGSGYTVVPRLASELGLTLRRVDPGTAVAVGGHLHRFRSDRPQSQLTGGLLPWRAAPRALAGLARAGSAVRGRSNADLEDWTDLDHETADAWSRGMLGPTLTDRLVGPTIHGFYFQTLTGNSAALAGAVASFGVRPGSTLTIDGGLGRLTQALSARLDVRLEQPVSAIWRRGRTAVVVTAAGELEADRVIVALPGAAALEVVTDASVHERELMATPYSRGLVVGIPMLRRLRAGELAGAYGVLVHPDEGSAAAAVAVGSRAHAGTASGDLLTVMFSDERAAALADAGDEQVAETACAAVEQLDPGVAPLRPDDLAHVRVVRHAQAMPHVPVGHAAAVARYRRQRRSSTDPVVLAGDYLGFPWTDSAASTGLWAAQLVSGTSTAQD